MIEYIPSNCFIERFRAAVSVLIGPCCPALLTCIDVDVHEVFFLPYSLPSVGPGADPGVQAVSPQVT